jgi:hypothetical protein
MKTGCNLAESSKEGYGSRRDVLPMMMIIMISYNTVTENTNQFFVILEKKIFQ